MTINKKWIYVMKLYSIVKYITMLITTNVILVLPIQDIISIREVMMFVVF